MRFWQFLCTIFCSTAPPPKKGGGNIGDLYIAGLKEYSVDSRSIWEDAVPDGPFLLFYVHDSPLLYVVGGPYCHFCCILSFLFLIAGEKTHKICPLLREINHKFSNLLLLRNLSIDHVKKYLKIVQSATLKYCEIY